MTVQGFPTAVKWITAAKDWSLWSSRVRGWCGGKRRGEGGVGGVEREVEREVEGEVEGGEGG